MVIKRICSEFRALDKFQKNNHCKGYNQAQFDNLDGLKPGLITKKLKSNQHLFLKLTILLIGFGIILNVNPVSAKTHRIKIKGDNTDPVTVQVLPQLPADNLGGDHLGYFDLPMKANQDRRETIELYNPTNQVIQVRFKAVDATTNDNGTVDYSGAKAINPVLLKQPAAKMIEVPKKLKIQPQATQNVVFKVNQLKNGFKGQKASAINITASGVNNKRSSIQNQYVYAIGMVLQGSTLKKQQMKKLRPEGIKVRILQDKKAAISVKLANPDATYLKHSTIKMRLTNQKYFFFSYQSTKKELKIAPNSDFYNDLLLGGKRLVPGVYNLTVTIKNDQYQKATHKYVEITKNQACFINAHNYLYLKYRNRILMGLGGLIVALLSYVGITKRQRTRRKKDLNE